MGEESPTVLPGEALEVEETHHPLQGAGEAGGLIRHGLSGRESKFERNGLVGAQGFSLGKFLKHSPCLMMAAKSDQCGIRRVGPESINPVSVLKQRNLVALLVEVIGGREAGEAGTYNQNCLGCLYSHENRERSHTPRAIITRWVVVRLIRGPNT